MFEVNCIVLTRVITLYNPVVNKYLEHQNWFYCISYVFRVLIIL